MNRLVALVCIAGLSILLVVGVKLALTPTFKPQMATKFRAWLTGVVHPPKPNDFWSCMDYTTGRSYVADMYRRVYVYSGSNSVPEAYYRQGVTNAEQDFKNTRLVMWRTNGEVSTYVRKRNGEWVKTKVETNRPLNYPWLRRPSVVGQNMIMPTNVP